MTTKQDITWAERLNTETVRLGRLVATNQFDKVITQLTTGKVQNGPMNRADAIAVTANLVLGLAVSPEIASRFVTKLWEHSLSIHDESAKK